jgi:hypothetical protein
MRGILFRVMVLLMCVVASSCSGGDDNPTSPDNPTGGGSSGGGSGGSGGDGGSGSRGTAVASDNIFDDTNWDTELQVFGAGGTGGGSHVRFNGQEGADYRRINIAVNSAGSGSAAQVAVFSIRRGTSYFPTSDGAINSIDYSEDSILFSGGGVGQYSAPAFRQNGKLYTLVPGAGAFPTPEAAWTPHSITGLRQNDFRTIASASDHPDFSATGSRIDVGFMRLVTVPAGGGPDNKIGGIDNWRITFNR